MEKDKKERYEIIVAQHPGGNAAKIIEALGTPRRGMTHRRHGEWEFLEKTDPDRSASPGHAGPKIGNVLITDLAERDRAGWLTVIDQDYDIRNNKDEHRKRIILVDKPDLATIMETQQHDNGKDLHIHIGDIAPHQIEFVVESIIRTWIIGGYNA